MDEMVREDTLPRKTARSQSASPCRDKKLARIDILHCPAHVIRREKHERIGGRTAFRGFRRVLSRVERVCCRSGHKTPGTTELELNEQAMET